MALTEDAGRRTDRALAAAQAHLHAGSFDEALRLLAAAEVDARNELQRAHAELLRGQVTSAAGSRTEAAAQLLKAARRLEALDANLARETYLDAWNAANFAAQLEGGGGLREVSQAALAFPAPSGPPRLCDLLLDGLSMLITEGNVSATPILRQAVAAFRDEELSVEKGLQWGSSAIVAAAIVWDFEGMAAIASRQSELARRAGALGPLCFTLTGEVYSMAWRGDFAAATALAAEADALAHAIGLRQAPLGALLLAALQGDEPYSSRFIEAAIAEGAGFGAETALFANAILSNALGRYEDALSLSLRASAGELSKFLGLFVLPELVEAAVRTGNPALARDTFGHLANSTDAHAPDWGQGILARCQALISDDESCEAHYLQAIECLGRTTLRPEHARSYLLHGEWLRRQDRQLDARRQLRIAYDMFSEIGMLAFAERALHELQATGETVRKRQDDTRNDLTPQEEHIARLALEGRTNPEIGAQLFISARTVEWHLRKVFMKLGITSRRGLRNALPARTAPRRPD